MDKKVLYLTAEFSDEADIKATVTQVLDVAADIPNGTSGVEVFSALTSWKLKYAHNDYRPWAHGGIATSAVYDSAKGTIRLTVTGTLDDGNSDDGVIMSGKVLLVAIYPDSSERM